MPGDDIANPFQQAALRIPNRDWDLVEKFTASQQAGADPDKTPFRRYVDLWWAALCVGLQEGYPTDLPTANDWHRFNDGVVLSTDPWRIIHLQLIAIGLKKDVAILDDPNGIIQMANAYAATGLPLLLDEMSHSTEPIMVASEFLRKRSLDFDAVVSEDDQDATQPDAGWPTPDDVQA